MRPRRHREVFQTPVVERPMILEFERADRVGHALDGVRLAVGEIVARIDAPGFAGARMFGVEDAIEHRIAQVDVARAHVDLGAQHARAVRKLAGAHAAEQIEIFLDASPAVRALGAGLGQGAAGEPHLLLGLIVDIGLAGADQVLGPGVELLEIIGRVKEIACPNRSRASARRARWRRYIPATSLVGLVSSKRRLQWPPNSSAMPKFRQIDLAWPMCR